MSDPTFMADPTRLVIAAIVGIALLLALIIKFKLHPVLSMMVSALVIGIGAGMPLDMVADTVTKGVGTTLQNIALLIGLGSMFGQILEESGGAKKIAQTFIDTFGQGHSSWALGITGLVIGTTVFFEAGVVVLIPLAFSVASQTKKSTLYYGIALLAGLAAGYAFVPPSAGSVLVAGTLGVDLGTMILVGIPTAFIAMAIAGVIWGRNVGGRIFTDVPEHFTSAEGASDEKELPPFGMVLAIVLTPLCLILLGTLSSYIPMPAELASILAFLGKPFVALTLATLVAMYLLGARRGYSGAELKALLDRIKARPPRSGVSGGDVPAFAGVVPQVVELFRRIVSHFGVGRFVPGRGVARGDVFPAVGDDRERLREVDADDVFRPFGVGSEECPEVVPAVGRGPFGQRGSAERGQRGVEVDMAQQGV